MEQEDGASGKSLISHYRRNVLDGFDFRGVHPTGSKEVRAQPVAARAEAGEVKLVAGPWIDEFLSELASFPEGLHDDQVDALSGAFSALAGKPAVGRFRPQGETAKSYWLD
jgi:predicted phage terminase large subunit-like protein